MLRDHQFLVGWYDVDRNTAVGSGYQTRMAGILSLVDGHTKPPQLIGDTCPDTHRVLSDASRKDEAVEPLQCGCKHAGVQADPINEVVDRQFRLGIFASLQFAHIIADARE